MIEYLAGYWKLGRCLALDEMKQAVAFIFRLKGKKSMSKEDFKMTSSMELHWFSPSEAEMFVDLALQGNYLEAKDDAISVTFNTSLIDIPIDFIPSKGVLVPPKPKEEQDEDIFMVIVETIINGTGVDRKDVISKINRLQSRMNIEIEAAALIIAKEAKIETDKYMEEVERAIDSRHS